MTIDEEIKSLEKKIRALDRVIWVIEKFAFVMIFVCLTFFVLDLLTGNYLFAGLMFVCALVNVHTSGLFKRWGIL